MSPSEEQAIVLLEKGRADLAAAVELSRHVDIADSIVGFHCHQAIEKSLKAVLARRGIDFPKTHDLGFLADLVADAEIESALDPADRRYLGPWATEYRYDDPGDVTLDRQRATVIARQVVDWAAVQVSAT